MPDHRAPAGWGSLGPESGTLSESFLRSPTADNLSHPKISARAARLPVTGSPPAPHRQNVRAERHRTKYQIGVIGTGNIFWIRETGRYRFHEAATQNPPGPVHSVSNLLIRGEGIWKNLHGARFEWDSQK